MGISCALVACKTPPPRYTSCVLNPKAEVPVGVCNRTGDVKDNYNVAIPDMENYGCFPPADLTNLLQELTILRGKCSQ